VSEPDLSQGEQVSQGGEPTVDRGDPFGLLGYDCSWLKLERVRQGYFRGPILDPLLARATSPNFSALYKFNLIVYKRIASIC
jgi:hypothetical protein